MSLGNKISGLPPSFKTSTSVGENKALTQQQSLFSFAGWFTVLWHRKELMKHSGSTIARIFSSTLGMVLNENSDELFPYTFGLQTPHRL